MQALCCEKTLAAVEILREPASFFARIACMEAHEMQEYSNQLKEASEESGGESLKTISLAISILAVLVAMVTVLGHRSHTEAILAQARAGDTWTQYGEKRVRYDQTNGNVDLLSLQPNSNNDKVEAKLAEYRARQEKLLKELDKLQEQAKDFAADVQHAEAQASRYDLGEALLQIGVVLCSITLFTRRHLYFMLGLGLGAAGVICAALAVTVH
jgi:Domain of unknown function (DUF4337)